GAQPVRLRCKRVQRQPGHLRRANLLALGPGPLLRGQQVTPSRGLEVRAGVSDFGYRNVARSVTSVVPFVDCDLSRAQNRRYGAGLAAAPPPPSATMTPLLTSLLMFALGSPGGADTKKHTPAVDGDGELLPGGAFARLGTLRFHAPYWIRSLAFAPDGKTIVSAGDGTAHVWDAATGKLVRSIKVLDRDGTISSIALSADGKALAVGGSEGALRMWDTVSGKEIRRFEYPGFVHGLALSPDGTILAVGGTDKTVRLW